MLGFRVFSFLRPSRKLMPGLAADLTPAFMTSEFGLWAAIDPSPPAM
jgi:hypothetical protein